LTVRPPVYIPRIETEQWVILLGELIYSTISAQTTPSFSESRPFRILDICSGSGCIPLLLAELGQGKIHTVGLEVDDRALAVARENATRNGIDHLARFEKFDLFEDGQDAQEDLKSRSRTDGRDGFGFDMVVSNPPYVSSEDMRKVEKTWHEGKFALQGKLRGRNGSIGEDAKQEAAGDEEVLDGDDGYSFYRRIKTVYPAFLDESAGTIDTLPKLVLEVGSTQSRPVQEMYASEGRLEIQRETARRKEIGAPKLEDGDMVGTERSIWIYRQA
jgi:methylase of polypeptide subunit release factors